MTLLIRRKWKIGTNLLLVHKVKFTQRRVWFNGEHWLVKILTLLKIKLHLLSKRGKVVLVHDLKPNSDLFHIELSFIYNFAFELWAWGNLHWFTCLLDQESYLINYLESESSVHDRNIFWFMYQELIQVIQISTRAPWCSVNSHKRVPSQFISNYLPSTLGHLLPVQASHWSRQITCIEDWHLIGQGGTHTHTSPVTLHYYVRIFKTNCIFVFLRDQFFANLSPTPIHM